MTQGAAERIPGSTGTCPVAPLRDAAGAIHLEGGPGRHLGDPGVEGFVAVTEPAEIEKVAGPLPVDCVGVGAGRADRPAPIRSSELGLTFVGAGRLSSLVRGTLCLPIVFCRSTSRSSPVHQALDHRTRMTPHTTGAGATTTAGAGATMTGRGATTTGVGPT
jgi:hypothetical protein